MTQPIYQKLANNLQQQINQGNLSPGDKLPSVRRLSSEHKVSPGTVLNCYSLLEQMELIEARPQSGYYVLQPKPDLMRHPSVMKPVSNPVNVTMGDLALQVITATDNPTGTPMGPAYPSNEFSLSRQLWKEFGRQTRQHASAQTPHASPLGYSVPPGDTELIRQLARHYGPLSLDINPESIVITNGCQEALNLSLQAVTKPGDIVAVESPVFYGTLQLMEALGLKVIEIPATPEQGISLEALKMALQQWPIKAIFLSANIGNPLGYLMPDSHKEALVQLLQQYDLPLIEDDVFGDLAYTQGRPLPVKAFDKDGRVLWCSSISKTIDPAIRIGWLSAGRYHDRVRYLKYVSTMASPTIPQRATAKILQGSGYYRHLRIIRDSYRKRRDQMISWTQRYMPEATRMTFPQGGFLLWLELPEGCCNSLEIYHRALEQQISIAPGILFSASNNYHRCIRLNYACADNEDYGQAIRTLSGLLQ